jgi:hypothetical protein
MIIIVIIIAYSLSWTLWYVSEVRNTGHEVLKAVREARGSVVA